MKTLVEHAAQYVWLCISCSQASFNEGATAAQMLRSVAARTCSRLLLLLESPAVMMTGQLACLPAESLPAYGEWVGG